MSLKRQTVWNMMPLLVVSGVNIFSVPLFYRYLGADLYALWFYVITFTGVFGFADLGLGVAVSRFIGVAIGRGDYAAVREYWGTGNLIALPLLLAMGLGFAGVGWRFGPEWFNVSPGNEDLLRYCFLAGGAGLFLSYYAQLWNVLVQAHMDFKYSSLLRVGTTLGQVLPSIAIARATHNPLWICLWTVAVGAGQLAAIIWHARRRHQLGFAFAAARRDRLREMAGYTGKTFALLVTGSLFGSIDRLILGKLAAGGEFARYAICGNVGNRLQGLSVAVMGPVFHNTSRAAGSARPASAAAIFDEMFQFVFGWYLLAAVWAVVWHRVALHFWLGAELGGQVAGLFPPVVVAFCFTALASISASQLGALNRVGTLLGFSVATGVATVAGVGLGWRLGGLPGGAYGFLASRVVCLAQDIFVMRLVSARGWWSGQTWRALGGQGLVAAVFWSANLIWPPASAGMLFLALLHGGLVAAWLLRQPLRKLAGGISL